MQEKVSKRLKLQLEKSILLSYLKREEEEKKKQLQIFRLGQKKTFLSFPW